MARMHQWLGIVSLALVLTGCVAQEKYNALKMDRDQLAEHLAQAEGEAKSARAEADAYKNQLNALMRGGGDLQALVSNLTKQNGELQGQYDELNKKYQELLARPAMAGSPLPEQLDTALKQFAQQNPDLVEYDSARGIVKFKSDVTFSAGSAEVTAKAKDAISRFSQILTSSAAGSFELMIAGHTDNTKVVNPQTIAAGHKDNWYLSAHRAISVSNELRSHGVAAQRLAVVGYADQRPVASNGSESGRSQNRRVEVLILPTTVHNGPEAAPTKSAPKLNKDSMSKESGPSLNK